MRFAKRPVETTAAQQDSVGLEPMRDGRCRVGLAEGASFSSELHYVSWRLNTSRLSLFCIGGYGPLLFPLGSPRIIPLQT